jgi:hypothetical protein
MLFGLLKNKREDMVVGHCVTNPFQKVGECRLSLLLPLCELRVTGSPHMRAVYYKLESLKIRNTMKEIFKNISFLFI